MEHEHEPLIGLDGLLTCRICGDILESITETIGRVQSAKRARRIIEEIASAGEYIVTDYNGIFVTYSRDRNNITESITANKLGQRKFIVIKSTIAKGGD